MTIDTQGRPFGGAIMNIDKGEKLYKVYRFIPKKNPGYYFEYRILTKIKPDGNLAMAAYNYKVVNGVVEKGNVMKSDDVPKKEMENLIRGDRKSVVQGKSVDLGGRRIIKKKRKERKRKKKKKSTR